jgi:hypothetical protein
MILRRWIAMSDETSTGNAADLFADAPYDAATLASMFEAYAAAWHELQMMNVVSRSGEEMRPKLVLRILKAAAAGERDPDRMKLLALHAIDGR